MQFKRIQFGYKMSKSARNSEIAFFGIFMVLAAGYVFSSIKGLKIQLFTLDCAGLCVSHWMQCIWAFCTRIMCWSSLTFQMCLNDWILVFMMDYVALCLNDWILNICDVSAGTGVKMRISSFLKCWLLLHWLKCA